MTKRKIHMHGFDVGTTICGRKENDVGYLVLNRHDVTCLDCTKITRDSKKMISIFKKWKLHNVVKRSK